MATEAFNVITDAHKYLLFKYCKDRFLKDFGISEILNNPFHLKKTTVPPPTEENNQEFKSDWQHFVLEVIKNKVNIELLNKLFSENELAYKNKLMRDNYFFRKLFELLKSNYAEHISTNWELYFELIILHRLQHQLTHFKSFEQTKKKGILLKILFRTN